MSKALYYKKDVMKEVNNALAKEICEIVHNNESKRADLRPDLTDTDKIMLIRGMYLLFYSIAENMEEEEE